jgi:transaldolase
MGSWPASRRRSLGAHQHPDRLRAVGVDYDDVTQSLEDDGVSAFDASWSQAGERLAR